MDGEAWIHWGAAAIELIGSLIIVVASLVAVVRFFLRLRQRDAVSLIDQVRLRLGKSMVLGLEFLVGADILKTAADPTWNTLAMAAATILLRALLNFSLEKEIRGVEAQMQTVPGDRSREPP